MDIEDNNIKVRSFAIETSFYQIEIVIEYTVVGKWPYQTFQVISRVYILIL